MDSHIEALKPGLSSGSHTGDDGADYLRQLKTEANDAAPPRLNNSSVPPAATSSPTFKERRRSPRFRCSGSTEFWVEGSDVRMWGTLMDVSLHGCYVEMPSTFPVNTRVSLTIEALGVRVHGQAIVRVSYPFLGMGVCFSEIETRRQLEQLLAALSGQSSIPNSASTATSVAQSIPSLADVDSKTMLDELAQFFRSDHLLSREEFYRIAKRARR